VTKPKEEGGLVYLSVEQKKALYEEAELSRLEKYDKNQLWAIWWMVGQMYSDVQRRDNTKRYTGFDKPKPKEAS